MLADVVEYLRCPVCGEPVSLDTGSLCCRLGHAYDVARQGYVNLLPGGAVPGTADTAQMVAARDEFLGRGHYDPIVVAVADMAALALASGPDGCVMDAGAGTGRYLAAVLDALPGRAGLALDISKHAARRAAGAHHRIGAAVCDTWRPLPVRTGCAALVLDVFAPRNAHEFARAVHPGGALIVVTPEADHLGEIVAPLDLLAVDDRKSERLAGALAGWFEVVEESPVRFAMALTRPDIEALAGMGPTAKHAAMAQVRRDIAALPEPLEVTASVRVSLCRPAGRRSTP